MAANNEALRQRRLQFSYLVHDLIPRLRKAQEEGRNVNLGPILKVSRGISGEINDLEREGRRFGFWRR